MSLSLHDDERFQPVAAVLACVLPGAGHLYLGYLHRGLLIGGGVLTMFFGGLFIGGIDSIDSHEDRIWFIGQAMVGPVAFGVNYAHQANFKGYDSMGRLRSPGPNEGIVSQPDRAGQLRNMIVPGTPKSKKSLGRANELGTLVAALAGMMNLIAIFDAAHGRRRPKKVGGGA